MALQAIEEMDDAFATIWAEVGQCAYNDVSRLVAEPLASTLQSDERTALLARFCCSDPLSTEHLVRMRCFLSLLLEMPEEKQIALDLVGKMARRMIRSYSEPASHYAAAATRGLYMKIESAPKHIELLLPFFVRLCSPGDIFSPLPTGVTADKPKKKLASAP